MPKHLFEVSKFICAAHVTSGIHKLNRKMIIHDSLVHRDVATTIPPWPAAECVAEVLS